MKDKQQIVRHRNHSKRFLGWIIIYLLIFAAFLGITYRQSIKVNTLDFPTGTIQLVTSKTKYTAGDTVTYTINNGLSNNIILNSNCPQEPLHIYEWTNSTWVRIHDTANTSVCIGQPTQVSILSGGSLTKDLSNWPNLFKKPGIYRMVAYANNYTGIPYADFQVVAAPSQLTTTPAAPQVIYKTIIQVQKVLVPVPSNDN